jgi:hypothetical protein
VYRPGSYSPIIASRLRIIQVHAAMMNAKVVFRLSRTSLVLSYRVVNNGSERSIERRALARRLDMEASVFSQVGLFTSEWEVSLLVTSSKRRRLESSRFHQGVSEWWDNQSHICCYRLGLARASESTRQNGYTQASFCDGGQIIRSIKQCLVTAYCTPWE